MERTGFNSVLSSVRAEGLVHLVDRSIYVAGDKREDCVTGEICMPNGRFVNILKASAPICFEKNIEGYNEAGVCEALSFLVCAKAKEMVLFSECSPFVFAPNAFYINGKISNNGDSAKGSLSFYQIGNTEKIVSAQVLSLRSYAVFDDVA